MAKPHREDAAPTRIMREFGMSFSRKRLGLYALGLLLALPALAQHTRMVRGSVLNRRQQPVAHAIVYLRNSRSRTVRTYITSHNGRFVFHGLAANVNYTLHAEYRGRRGGTRTVSAFDSQTRIHMDLKVP